MRILSFVLLMLLPLQEPSRHDKYADDPKAYCLMGKPMPGDKHGHECHCELMCSLPDKDGHRERIENNKCELYCTMSRCTCHSEESCEEEK